MIKLGKNPSSQPRTRHAKRVVASATRGPSKLRTAETFEETEMEHFTGPAKQSKGEPQDEASALMLVTGLERLQLMRSSSPSHPLEQPSRASLAPKPPRAFASSKPLSLQATVQSRQMLETLMDQLREKKENGTYERSSATIHQAAQANYTYKVNQRKRRHQTPQ